MIKKYSLNDIKNIKLDLKIPSIIFLYWDLWAWKTTFTKHILNNLLWIDEEIKSPTYTYYNKYLAEFDWKKIDIYHFDLYRLKNYDEFFAIGWEEIFDNNNWIIIVEWPELIEKYYKSDINIWFEKSDEKNRKIDIKYNY